MPAGCEAGLLGVFHEETYFFVACSASVRGARRATRRKGGPASAARGPLPGRRSYFDEYALERLLWPVWREFSAHAYPFDAAFEPYRLVRETADGLPR